ncbi:PAS domain S-box-containing protein [Povalibacter uvarum]|uniref:PAS domain S-box-containing protein n=1 Tax=Povalibacter uvarum TaxID=732238 RepID=A0A841HUU0_9GAMM|nr:PAS domain S-box protein [Povalibacter uvarum]MBB6096424.1 PAS domain S-box-containing protein [Povalibacter uvarum]
MTENPAAQGQSLLEVLIVDGDASECEQLESLLASHKIRSVCVHSLEAAREAIRAIYFPLIVVDRFLPDGDSTDLCREHRASVAGRRTRILMLADGESAEDSRLALAAGADEYLSKSQSDRLLVSRIRQLYATVMRKAVRRSGNAESESLRSLEEYDILDSAPEGAFDDIALLASTICRTPIALISLVDGERQWFKSRIGLPVRETHRAQAFCAHAIQRPDELMIVADVALDARFASNPLVTEDPHIRFYAGAPVVSAGGHALATVCVLDRTPRTLDAAACEALRALSRQVGVLLEQRKLRKQLEDATVAQRAADADLARSELLFREAYENAAIGIALVSLNGHWLRVNRAICDLLGYTPDQLLRLDFQAVTHPDDLDKDLGLVHQMLDGTIRSYEMEKRYIHRNGQEVWALLSVSMVRDEADRPLHFISQVVDITERKRSDDVRQALLSRLSQELRVPATALRHSVGRLASGAAGQLACNVHELARVAQRDADRLHQLIEGLREASNER